MDFDHVQGTKKYDIGEMAGLSVAKLDRLINEVAKCEIVCACCHRIRTKERRNTLDYKDFDRKVTDKQGKVLSYTPAPNRKGTETMNENLTYIAVVLDRSGSMQNVQQATIEGFKTFLNEQKKTPGEGLFTLIQFDTKYEVHEWEKPLNKASFETFEPRGGTALLDALGKTITDVGNALATRPESARPGKVLFVIITDGEENSSREFTRDQVFNMITHQREKYSWEFLFLGANQDAIATATSMGMSPQSALSYVSNPVGAYNAFSTASASTRSYRKGATKNAVVSEEQKSTYETNTAAGVTLPENPVTPTPGGGSTP